MEETASCLCGSQVWYIYNDRIECAQCHEKYSWDDEFNIRAYELSRIVNSKFSLLYEDK
jgi:hypothetical protein